MMKTSLLFDVPVAKATYKKFYALDEHFNITAV